MTRFKDRPARLHPLRAAQPTKTGWRVVGIPGLNFGGPRATVEGIIAWIAVCLAARLG
jgi:hypothetical protein